MKFWIPVVSKWQPKQYKTLANVPEGVPCFVEYDDMLLIRSRHSSSGCQVGYHDGKPRMAAPVLPATQYNFVRTLDPLPEPKVTINDLPDGRCFKAGQLLNSVYWKHNGTYYVLGDGRFGHSSPFNHVIYPDAVLDIEMQLQDFPETQSN
jgi:hypothetical protein